MLGYLYGKMFGSSQTFSGMNTRIITQKKAYKMYQETSRKPCEAAF